ncbi:hypothetical protein [Pontibacter liquoris]|uniref:hypothetical protein n=1 Tax=Pontibacter liquoris TaxID=2905677 RepID=UPI001FA6D049|nr:hypothetical protein [Pontibacter liquoris]
MKLKNTFLPAMFLFGVVALSSCEKNDQESVNPTVAAQGQISRITVDSADVTSYNFAGKQLSQVNHYNKETGELESFEKYTYDAKGKALKATTHTGSSHAVLAEQVFKYDNTGLLRKALTNYFDGSKVAFSTYATFEYDANSKLEKKSVFEGQEKKGAKAKSFVKYEVLPNGDLGQEKQYVVGAKGATVLFSTTTYSYDNNKNPFATITEPGKVSSPNNLIASRTLVHGSKKVYNYKYSYEYDKNGLPLSQTVTTPNGKSETYTYQYSK